MKIGARAPHPILGSPMRKSGLKALFSILALSKAGKKRRDWDRIILIFSTAVTIGLVALYVYGKATSRW
jgi:hypothetical protein